jgi:hypothetical protein
MEHYDRESPPPNRRQFLLTIGSTVAAGVIAPSGRLINEFTSPQTYEKEGKMKGSSTARRSHQSRPACRHATSFDTQSAGSAAGRTHAYGRGLEKAFGGVESRPERSNHAPDAASRSTRRLHRVRLSLAGGLSVAQSLGQAVKTGSWGAVARSRTCQKGRPSRNLG